MSVVRLSSKVAAPWEEGWENRDLRHRDSGSDWSGTDVDLPPLGRSGLILQGDGQQPLLSQENSVKYSLSRAACPLSAQTCVHAGHVGARCSACGSAPRNWHGDVR